MKPLSALVCWLALSASALAGVGEDYPQTIERARAARLSELTQPDGWLSLIGLHFLQPGANTVGQGSDNAIVLAAGPAHLGTVTLTAEGTVKWTAVADDATVDGQSVHEATLVPRSGSDAFSLVAAGTVNFFVIERGGRLALRVRDRASARRVQFQGLEYFPIDPSWRVEAEWVPAGQPREFAIKNVIGAVSRASSPGKAVFRRDGHTYELWPLAEPGEDGLFFVFADRTSGHETYMMRFLDAASPRDGKVILDFNLAENPPCAFTPFATCPLPPAENDLPLAITAGEKVPAGAHH